MPVTTFLDRRPFTQLRGAAFLYLQEIGHVVSPTATSDSGGGGSVAWVEGTADIPCMIDVAGGAERLVGEKIAETTTHFVVIPAWISLDESDRFSIENRGTFVITSKPGQRVFSSRQRTGEALQTLEVAEAP